MRKEKKIKLKLSYYDAQAFQILLLIAKTDLGKDIEGHDLDLMWAAVVIRLIDGLNPALQWRYDGEKSFKLLVYEAYAVNMALKNIDSEDEQINIVRMKCLQDIGSQLPIWKSE